MLIPESDRRGVICNQTLVEDTRKDLGGTDNKDDAFDALIMWLLYRRCWVEQYDRRFWVKYRHAIIRTIRKLLLDLKNVIKKRTQVINASKQRLCLEHPRKAKIQSKRKNGELHPDKLPAFWAWLAEWYETPTWKMTKGVRSRFENEYLLSLKVGEASEISWLTRDLARAICQWHIDEALLEQELLPLVHSTIFDWYQPVFDKFGFQHRERGWILARVYPFEDFLDNGQAIVQYTKSSNPDKQGKKTPKKRSLRRFRQALGVGKIQKSSGQKKAGGKSAKNVGSADARSTLWTYVSTRIEKGLLKEAHIEGKLFTPEDLNRAKIAALLKKGNSCPKTEVCQQIRDYFISKAFDLHETKSGYRLEKVKGSRIDDARNATCRRIAEILFRELLFQSKSIAE